MPGSGNLFCGAVFLLALAFSPFGPAEAQADRLSQCRMLAGSANDPEVAISRELYQITPDAIEICRAAVTESPNDPASSFYLARALAAQDHWDAAIAALRPAFEASYPMAVTFWSYALYHGHGMPADTVAANRLAIEGYEAGNLSIFPTPPSPLWTSSHRPPALP